VGVTEKRMGNQGSVSKEEIAEKNHLSVKDVEALYEAFQTKNKKAGPVKLKKFREILEAAHKIHNNDDFGPDSAELVFTIFDADHNGKVDAMEFISGVAMLANGSVEEKAKLIFNAIDRDGNGKISKKEFTDYVEKTIDVAKAVYLRQTKEEGLNAAMRLGLKVAMKVAQGTVLDKVVEEAFEADQDGDGSISLEEWLEACNSGMTLSTLSSRQATTCRNPPPLSGRVSRRSGL